MVAAAVIGAAVVGAAATTVASSRASSATKDATNASIAAQNSALTKQQQLSQPYSDIGTGGTNPDGTPKGGGAIDQYKNLLGLGTGGTADIQKTLAATPGYQFAKEQGLTATTNAASATGMGLSGNTLEALDRYSTGLADSTYQNAVGNAQNAVTIGQNAAAGTGAAVQQNANNNSNALLAQGSTLAGIDANAAASYAKIAGNAANQYTTYNTLAGLNNQTPTYAGGQPSGGVVNAPLATPDPLTTKI